MRNLSTYFFGILLALTFHTVSAQGIIVNEISNGPSGSQEYFEFVVVGPNLNQNCGPIDIRNWIFDDNNGDFSCGPCAGTGIAAGHIKFGNLAVWSAVPTGSIIVVYDAAVKNISIPADDPNDTSPTDGVYILPNSHASLDVSTTPCGVGNIPTASGACGSCTGNISYTSACYTPGISTACTGLRNTGDAAQTRLPGGAYFHGISYGTAPSLMNGGPNNIFFPIDGTGTYFAMTNAVDNNFRNGSNFVSGLVSSNGETPGAANSINNGLWVTALRQPCILPVNYYAPLAGRFDGNSNLLTWTTASESNSDIFELERTSDLNAGFSKIHTIQAAGNSSQLKFYQFVDQYPEKSRLWYRLKQLDLDGKSILSETIEIRNPNLNHGFVTTWPNPSQGTLNIHAEAEGIQKIQFVDLLGRVIREEYPTQNDATLDSVWDLGHLPNGNYSLKLSTNSGLIVKRIELLHE